MSELSSPRELSTTSRILSNLDIDKLYSQAKQIFEDYGNANSDSARQFQARKLRDSAISPPHAYFLLVIQLREHKQSDPATLLAQYEEIAELIEQPVAKNLLSSAYIIKAIILSLNNLHEAADQALIAAKQSELTSSYTGGMANVLFAIAMVNHLTTTEKTQLSMGVYDGEQANTIFSAIATAVSYGFNFNALINTPHVQQLVRAIKKSGDNIAAVRAAALDTQTLSMHAIFTTNTTSIANANRPAQQRYAYHFLAIAFAGQGYLGNSTLIELNFGPFADLLVIAKNEGLDYRTYDDGYWQRHYFDFIVAQSWSTLYSSLAVIPTLYQRGDKKATRQNKAVELARILTGIEASNTTDNEKIAATVQAMVKFVNGVVTLDPTKKQKMANKAALTTNFGNVQISDLARYILAVLQEQCGIKFLTAFDQLDPLCQAYLDQQVLTFPDSAQPANKRSRELRQPTVPNRLQANALKFLYPYVGQEQTSTPSELQQALHVFRDSANEMAAQIKAQNTPTRQQVSNLINARFDLLVKLVEADFDANRYFSSPSFQKNLATLLDKGRLKEGVQVFELDQIARAFGDTSNFDLARDIRRDFLLGIVLLSHGLAEIAVQYYLYPAYKSIMDNHDTIQLGILTAAGAQFMQQLFVDRRLDDLYRLSLEEVKKYIDQHNQDSDEAHQQRVIIAKEIKAAITQLGGDNEVADNAADTTSSSDNNDDNADDASTSSELDRTTVGKAKATTTTNPVTQFFQAVLPLLMKLAATRIKSNQRRGLNHGRISGNLPAVVKAILDLAIEKFGLTPQIMQSIAFPAQYPANILSIATDRPLAIDVCNQYVTTRYRQYQQQLAAHPLLAEAHPFGYESATGHDNQFETMTMQTNHSDDEDESGSLSLIAGQYDSTAASSAAASVEYSLDTSSTVSTSTTLRTSPAVVHSNANKRMSLSPQLTAAQRQARFDILTGSESTSTSTTPTQPTTPRTVVQRKFGTPADTPRSPLARNWASIYGDDRGTRSSTSSPAVSSTTGSPSSGQQHS